MSHTCPIAVLMLGRPQGDGGCLGSLRCWWPRVAEAALCLRPRSVTDGCRARSRPAGNFQVSCISLLDELRERKRERRGKEGNLGDGFFLAEHPALLASTRLTACTEADLSSGGKPQRALGIRNGLRGWSSDISSCIPSDIPSCSLAGHCHSSSQAVGMLPDHFCLPVPIPSSHPARCCPAQCPSIAPVPALLCGKGSLTIQHWIPAAPPAAGTEREWGRRCSARWGCAELLSPSPRQDFAFLR